MGQNKMENKYAQKYLSMLSVHEDLIVKCSVSLWGHSMHLYENFFYVL